jgi:hypothetical protein
MTDRYTNYVVENTPIKKTDQSFEQRKYKEEVTVRKSGSSL